MITFMRPSGNPITVNDTEENRELAASQGWKEAKPEKAKAEKGKTK